MRRHSGDNDGDGDGDGDRDGDGDGDDIPTRGQYRRHRRVREGVQVIVHRFV